MIRTLTMMLMVAFIVAGCSDDSENAGRTVGGGAVVDDRGPDEVVGGYFEEVEPSTLGSIAELRALVTLSDIISDDDVALSIEASCLALQTWPVEDAQSLLQIGSVDNPELEWLAAPQVDDLSAPEIATFVQASQEFACPATAERLAPSE